MNAQEILAQVHRLDAELIVVDGKLKASPPGVLPPELKAAIRDRAAEIKTHLRAEQDPSVAEPEAERIIEATFSPVSAPPAYKTAEFPPCPVCGHVRYWLASDGRVLCGTRMRECPALSTHRCRISRCELNCGQLAEQGFTYC
jgi:tubulysin polyketide synthase-like protein